MWGATSEGAVSSARLSLSFDTSDATSPSYVASSRNRYHWNRASCSFLRGAGTQRKPRESNVVRRGILFWREMLLNMMKVFATISFVRAFGTKGETKGDITKTVNKHAKCRQHFSPEKDPPRTSTCATHTPRRQNTTNCTPLTHIPHTHRVNRE